jgi:hypothetical protein
VQWGMDLSKFSPLQIKRILRCLSSLPSHPILGSTSSLEGT